MCPYNSIAHAFFALYKRDIDIRQLIVTSQLTFFQKLIELSKMPRLARQNEWFRYLKNPNVDFPPQKDMSGDITDDLDHERVFKLHESFETKLQKIRVCSNENCNNVRASTRHYAGLFVNQITDIENWREKIIHDLAIHQNCRACHGESVHVTVNFKNLIFLNINMLPGQALTMDKIPQTFEHGGEQFDFKFLVHFSEGNPGHFYSYAKLGN
jgi:hypothetical protein